jgi:hypothetical protein
MPRFHPVSHANKLINFVTMSRWGQYLRLLAYCSFVGVMIINFAPGKELTKALLKILAVSLLFSLCLKEWLNTPENWQRTRQAYRQSKRILLSAKELIPAEFRGWVKTFLHMQKACLRKPTAHLPHQGGNILTLSYLKNGIYTSLLPIIIIACVADIPLTQFILHLFKIDPTVLIVVHVATILLGVLTISSLIGDKRLLGEAQHYIQDDILHLCLGCRASADIPLCSILNAKLINHKDVVVFNTDLNLMEVTPFDKANVVLSLSSNADNNSGSRFEELGSARENIKTLKIYLDTPQKLIDSINKFQANATATDDLL